MVYGQAVVINATTGETSYRDLTPEEIAQRDAERAAGVIDAAQMAATETARQADWDEIRGAKITNALQAIEDDLTLLQGTPSAAQQRAILAGLLRRQRAIIKALARFV